MKELLVCEFRVRTNSVNKTRICTADDARDLVRAVAILKECEHLNKINYFHCEGNYLWIEIGNTTISRCDIEKIEQLKELPEKQLKFASKVLDAVQQGIYK